jgi:hypothetical protein
MNFGMAAMFPAPVIVLAASLCASVSGASGEPEATGRAHVGGPLLKEALAGPLKETSEIVFAIRAPAVDGHYYNPFPRRGGGGLHKLHLRTGRLTLLLDAGDGALRDPRVHYDGRKILFARCTGKPIDLNEAVESNPQAAYHLCEIGADGTDLRQLTAGPSHNIEADYLPDGGIVFCSSRCNRIIGCRTNLSTLILYRMDADGRNVRPLSSNAFMENTPAVLPDGRIMFTRWEYVDRDQLSWQYLWTVNPDGTRVMALFGNMHYVPGRVFVDARPVPGTSLVVAARSAHGAPLARDHGGYLFLFDTNFGPDEESHIRPLTHRVLEKGQARQARLLARDPWPLSAEWFLVAQDDQVLLVHLGGRSEVLYELYPGPRDGPYTPENVPAGWPVDQTALADAIKGSRRKVTALGFDGLLGEAGYWVHDPIPVAPRPREPVLPPQVDLTKATGVLVLADAHVGRNMAGVKPGEITKLLVLEQPPMPAHDSGTQKGMSNGGNFAFNTVLGTVPVEPDGSACMELPAMRSLLFVALDSDGLAVKRMQSFVTVMPGETTGCVGCHEERTTNAPMRPNLLALKRPPSRIEPIPGVPEVIDFRRDIQPILDRHCVTCHSPDKPAGRKVDLSAGAGRGGGWTPGYLALTQRDLGAVDGRGRPLGRHEAPPKYVSYGTNRAGNYPPRTLGSGGSLLMRYLRPDHPTCRHALTKTEYDTIRLWIEIGATFYGNHTAYKDWQGQMRRYGIEPAKDAEGRLDPFATERLYRQSLWWKPSGGGTEKP